jgi:hypothetical protein
MFRYVSNFEISKSRNHLSKIKNLTERRIVKEEHTLQASKHWTKAYLSIICYSIKVYDDFVSAGHGGWDPLISDRKVSDLAFLFDSAHSSMSKSNVLFSGRFAAGLLLKGCPYDIKKSDMGLRHLTSFFYLPAFLWRAYSRPAWDSRPRQSMVHKSIFQPKKTIFRGHVISHRSNLTAPKCRFDGMSRRWGNCVTGLSFLPSNFASPLKDNINKSESYQQFFVSVPI